MDKKNTMLLTVVAVATLLVAVVGATFAYFTATQTDLGGETQATVTTPTLATVSLENPTGALSVTVNNYEMAYEQRGAKYYATNVEGKNYETEAESVARVVSQVEVGGDDVTYNCDWNVNVTLGGTKAAGIATGDAQVIFSGALNQTVDVAAIADGGYAVSVDGLTSANDENDANRVLAKVVFNNTESDATQNALQGGTLIVSITNSNFTCTVAQ